MQQQNNSKTKTAGKNMPAKQKTVSKQMTIESVNEDAPQKADAAIVVGQRELQQWIGESRTVNEKIGELVVILKELEERGATLRQNVMHKQKGLRDAMNELYGEGSMLAEDGETVVLPKNENNVEDAY